VLGSIELVVYQADKHTHAINNKINEEKQMETCKEKGKNQRSRFLQEYENKNILHT
jgi:hypothetical protein